METISTEQTIEKIIENFDFDKVQKVMKLLDWDYWNDKDVSKSKLKNTAVSCMNHCCAILHNNAGKKRANYSSGGFVASARKYKDGEICLELSFQIASFNWSTKDTCY